MAGKRKSGRGFAGQYSVQEIDFWFTDPRIMTLPPAAKLLLFYLDMACVKERRETLPAYWNMAVLHDLTAHDTRTLQKACSALLQKCLIGIDDQNRITVYGVKKRHQNLKWKDGAYMDPNASANGAQAVSDKHYDAPALQAPDASEKAPVGRTWSDKVLDRVRSRRADDAA